MEIKNIKRICLWSGPRNISTALMYSFAQRADTKVFDEPLYAYFLANSPAREYHPGAEDVLATMENDGEKVIEMMLNANEKPVLFFKHMTHHLLNLDRTFLKDTVNVILTRNPEEMLVSYAKVIATPTMADVGYAMHGELIDYLHEIKNPPIVLDSKRVLENPRKTLTLLCEKLGIPFDENMLKWNAGPIAEDGVWAQYWYDSVHRSTQFSAYKASEETLPESLKPLLKECLPYYKELMKLSI